MPSRVSFVALLAFAAACGPATANITIGPMPEGGTFHGVWQSQQYGRMHLCQSQDVVVGEYFKDERHGRLQGRVRGDTLRFEWTDERELVVGRPNITNGHGYFQFRTSYEVPSDVEGEAPHTVELWNLQGEWGFDDDEVGGGTWHALLMPRERPTDCYASARTPPGQRGSGGDEDDIRFSDEEPEDTQPTPAPETQEPAGSN